jgi:hypothetical protein
VGSLEGTFPKTKWAQIPRENLCVCVDIIFLLLEAILYGSVQSVQQEERARFLRHLVGTKIEVVWSFFFLLLGRTDKAI